MIQNSRGKYPWSICRAQGQGLLSICRSRHHDRIPNFFDSNSIGVVLKKAGLRFTLPLPRWHLWAGFFRPSWVEVLLGKVYVIEFYDIHSWEADMAFLDCRVKVVGWKVQRDASRSDSILFSSHFMASLFQFLHQPPSTFPFLSSSLLKQPRDLCLHHQPKIKIGSQIGSAVFYQGIYIHPPTGRNSPFPFYNFHSLLHNIDVHSYNDSMVSLFRRLIAPFVLLVSGFSFCNILLWYSIFIRP